MSEYINRQKAVELIRSLEKKEAFHPADCHKNAGIIRAEYAICRMPAADVAEIRRGRWSDISGQACLCSVCGRPQNYKQAKGWRYCPMCGAIMNEGGGE